MNAQRTGLEGEKVIESSDAAAALLSARRGLDHVSAFAKERAKRLSIGLGEGMAEGELLRLNADTLRIEVSESSYKSLFQNTNKSNVLFPDLVLEFETSKMAATYAFGPASGLSPAEVLGIITGDPPVMQHDEQEQQLISLSRVAHFNAQLEIESIISIYENSHGQDDWNDFSARYISTTISARQNYLKKIGDSFGFADAQHELNEAKRIYARDNGFAAYMHDFYSRNGSRPVDTEEDVSLLTDLAAAAMMGAATLEKLKEQIADSLKEQYCKKYMLDLLMPPGARQMIPAEQVQIAVQYEEDEE